MDYFLELEDRLKRRIGGLPPEKIVFVGVGNRFRGDDAIGPLIIDLLKDHVPNAIDAGPSPENVTGPVKKLQPKATVLIDALIFKDLPPGMPQIVEIDDIAHSGKTTHVLSLDAVMEYLKLETGADVFMIGVQPYHITEDEGLSPGMKEKLDRLASVILKSIEAC